MRKKIKRNTFVGFCAGFVLLTGFVIRANGETENTFAAENITEAANSSFIQIHKHLTEPITKQQRMQDEDVELIALVTMAEAEGECEEGKRLVIDTILNRVDSEHFPDTIFEVVYQPRQFSSMWNGRAERCEVKDEICKLVMEEMDSRTNCDVVFFRADKYSAYGVPALQVGNHYFSTYD